MAGDVRRNASRIEFEGVDARSVAARDAAAHEVSQREAVCDVLLLLLLIADALAGLSSRPSSALEDVHVRRVLRDVDCRLRSSRVEG